MLPDIKEEALCFLFFETPKEQLYAEKHHEMIYHFLSHYQLDETEYYDVVVFGYLAAIQEYLRKPHLQCYCFSTIAWKNMYEAFLQELTYKNRSKRKAPLLSLQEDLALEELNQFLPNRLDALAEQLNDREIALELLSYLTPKEQEVVMLKADGYRVVADTYGVSFVMQSIEPGFEIYENTDDTGRFFCDRYSIRYENESFTTPSGQPISQIIECEEFFTSSESVLERFESAGYHAATLTELKEKLEGTGITIYEFKNSYK